jgi:hypothetical protein
VVKNLPRRVRATGFFFYWTYQEFYVYIHSEEKPVKPSEKVGMIIGYMGILWMALATTSSQGNKWSILVVIVGAILLITPEMIDHF